MMRKGMWIVAVVALFLLAAVPFTARASGNPVPAWIGIPVGILALGAAAAYAWFNRTGRRES